MFNKLTLALLLVALSFAAVSEAEAAGKKAGGGTRSVSGLDLGSTR